MAYLTYAEYKTMGGTLDEPTYSNYEFEAEALVNWYTFNRLKNDTTFPDELKRLMKCLVDLMQEKENLLATSGNAGEAQSGKGVVQSQSNDGVSVSYSMLSASDLLNTIKDEGAKKIQMYLQGVMNEAGRKVLYRGLYPGE